MAPACTGDPGAAGAAGAAGAGAAGACGEPGAADGAGADGAGADGAGADGAGADGAGDAASSLSSLAHAIANNATRLAINTSHSFALLNPNEIIAKLSFAFYNSFVELPPYSNLPYAVRCAPGSYPSLPEVRR